ncbi:hypothetical protein Tco_1389709 [Tanacetum coccineum]
MSYDLPLPGGHTPGSDEGRLKHDELMELVTKFSDRVVAVEEDLKQTKKTYSTVLTKLVLKVKKLEKQVGSGKARRRARIEDVETQEKNSEKELSTADVPVSTAGAEVSTAGAEVSTASNDVSTAAAALVYIRRSASKAKDKGKAIMQEPRPPKINFEAALELQRQLKEREEVPAEATQSQTIDWSDPAVLRYKQSYFKGMKYEEIRPIFEKVWDQTHTFVPMDSEDKEKGTEKKSGGTRKKTLAKKRAGEKQSDQSAKRQKTEYDTEKEELKAYLDIVPGEEFAMDFESLATKFPIVDWKTHVLAENFMYYQIFRADGSSKNYKIFSEMLDDFDRQDVLDLHRLVKARYMTSSPEGYDLMLWGDLKILFEPDEEDEVWKNQHEYNLISTASEEVNTAEGFEDKDMHQHWRTFAALINRSVSGKTSGLDKLHLSRA